MHDLTRVFLSILERIEAIVSGMETGNEKRAMEFTISEVKELIDYNEEGVGYELLCDNLYEFDVELDEELYQDIIKLGAVLTIDSQYWLYLQHNIK